MDTGSHRNQVYADCVDLSAWKMRLNKRPGDFSYFRLTANVKRAMGRILSRSMMCAALLASVLAMLSASWAEAQTAADAPLQISWEVRNRFRLFREERDFLLHTDAERGRSVLAAEQALELQSDGRGWARNTVNRLCIDLSGRVNEPCTRDNVKESYLTPVDHPIQVW